MIIDTVLDFDASSGTIMTTTADAILSFIESHRLKILRILWVTSRLVCRGPRLNPVYRETHAHADHLSASQYFKRKLGGNVPICIGERIKQVQDTFAPVYGFDSDAFSDTFDILLKDEEEFKIGGLACRVIHLPGHTPDHVGYIIGKVVFTGDSIFMVSAVFISLQHVDCVLISSLTSGRLELIFLVGMRKICML